MWEMAVEGVFSQLSSAVDVRLPAQLPSPDGAQRGAASVMPVQLAVALKQLHCPPTRGSQCDQRQRGPHQPGPEASSRHRQAGSCAVAIRSCPCRAIASVTFERPAAAAAATTSLPPLLNTMAHLVVLLPSTELQVHLEQRPPTWQMQAAPAAPPLPPRATRSHPSPKFKPACERPCRCTALRCSLDCFHPSCGQAIHVSSRHVCI